jgi:phage terminase small subunit
MSERTYRFGEEKIEAPDTLSPEDVRTAWAQVFPALENADVVQAEDGSYDFRVRAGTKGAERTYRFGEEKIEAPDTLSPEDVRTAWAQVFPALENADVVQAADGSYDFRVRAGTKG